MTYQPVKWRTIRSNSLLTVRWYLDPFHIIKDDKTYKLYYHDRLIGVSLKIAPLKVMGLKEKKRVIKQQLTQEQEARNKQLQEPVRLH